MSGLGQNSRTVVSAALTVTGFWPIGRGSASRRGGWTSLVDPTTALEPYNFISQSSTRPPFENECRVFNLR